MAQLLKHQDVLAALLDRISENQRSAASLMQNDEQPEKDSERKKEVDRVDEVIRAQATCNTHKRKLDDVNIDSNNDPNKENIAPCRVPKQLSLPGAPIKRIRREKTGTEWQLVFDILKYDEEIYGKRDEGL
ncbi:uncharacterized protein F5891DRAFT_1193342 [Suillus fuscotomentosus]|uniref:Uncharacterized protein n=1 Tax=Suillus fuscotomentosus TaxID=1912939 RepID=A0AAD4DY65_9AGAM|nr:uncharacterized protein F5891DRAFT_1193342 [Suillus fuscotomentosus]KAG1896107.1 hypothetical protein F5891DRAFT_1193342 [Suillus fuscotomentosus]